ncbi:hypothetical protein SCUP515_12221 [Seiridium cupressi]
MRNALQDASHLPLARQLRPADVPDEYDIVPLAVRHVVQRALELGRAPFLQPLLALEQPVEVPVLVLAGGSALPHPVQLQLPLIHIPLVHVPAGDGQPVRVRLQQDEDVGRVPDLRDQDRRVGEREVELVDGPVNLHPYA